MTQKVLKVGTSAAVTIPKKAMETLGIKIGDSVAVDIDREKKTLKISPATSVDAELMAWTKKFVERYRPALEALSKK